MIALIHKKPLVFFLVLTLLISWLPWYSGGNGIFVFGPSIAGVITVALVKGKEGLRDLMKRTLQWRVGWKWWLIALGFILAFGAKLPPFTFIKEQWYYLPLFFLITIVGGPLGEEFGWRGFALPRLQEQTTPLLASVVLGLIWGLWHIPQFFNPTAVHYELGLARLPLYVLAEVGLATIMTWVYNKTRGSLLVGGLIYHNADNFWGVVLLTAATFTTAMNGSDTAHTDLRLWTISAIVGLVAAAVIALATKGKLGKVEKPAV